MARGLGKSLDDGRITFDPGHSHVETTAKDPVCGTILDRATAAARSTHDGRIVFFCSTDCRDRYESEPETFPNSGQ